MASTILGLALKVTGDASGLAKSLTPVDKALASIGKQVERATAVFAPFTAASGAAATAQQDFADRFAVLAEQFKDNKDAVAYAEAFARLTAEAKDTAAAFAEGVRVTEANRTAEQNRAIELENLSRLLKLNAIDQDTYNRAAADASGASESIRKAEEEAARALEQRLDAERQFQSQSDAITAKYQTDAETRAATIADLEARVERGTLTEETFARAIADVSGANAAAAKAQQQRNEVMEEGARIQRQYGDQAKVVADEIARLVELEKLGAIDTTALNNAAIDRLGIDKQAAASAKERADSISESERLQAEAYAEARRIEEASAAESNRQRAALESEADRIRQASLTAQELFDRAIERAVAVKQAGLLTEQEFNKELERQAQIFAKATIAAGQFGKKIEETGKGSTLRFNELSGVLSALPGPLGSVAGRISGLASAGEGLARVFGGGLAQGLRGVGVAVAGLINPFTAALSGVAAFGATATAVARGLISLEDRVERLGNTADKLGVSFEFIQTLEEAANRSGTSIDAVSSAFTRLQRSVTGVDEESKAAQDALEAIGVTAAELQSLRPEDQYQLIADRIGAIEDPARRSVTAINLFGRAGAELLPFFNNIGVAADDMERFGSTLSTAQRRDIDEFGGAMDRLSTAASGAGNQIIASFTPAGTAIANSLATATGAVTKFAEEQNRVNQITQEFTKLRSEYTGVITAEMAAAINAGKTADEVLGRAAKSTAELKEAIEDPPTPEFLKTLASIDGQLEKAKQQSAEFGQAGFDAAVRFQSAVDDLKKKLDAGLFNEETFKREAERAGAAFKEELARVEEDAQLEIQIKSDAEKTLAGVNAEINKAAANATQFGKAGFDASVRFQEKLRDLGKQFDDGRINAATLAAEVQKSTAEYDKQIAGIKQIDELQKTLLKNDQDRVAALIAQGDTTTQAEKDIETVTREQLRLEEEIRKQRAAGNVLAADAAAARLAQLDQIQAKLADEQQAIDQGFGEGFAKSFEATNKSIDDLINKAADFGNAGAAAAQQLEAGIAAAQRMVEGGVLGKDAYEAEVVRQRQIFEDRLAGAQRVEEFLLTQIDERQRMELNAAKELEDRKILAAKNVEAIETKITETKLLLEKAREEGDLKAAKRRVDELNQLKGARQQEQAIADGKADNARQQFAQQAQQQQQLADQQQKAQEAAAQEQARQAEENRKAAEAEYNRQQDRLRQLNTLGSGSVKTTDVRTAEGAALVLDLAASAQDPALIEQRIQTKILNQIAFGLAGAASNYFNQPVAIVGAARLGGFN